MSKFFVVAGYGTGISHAVALKFGKEKGFNVALLSRTKAKLDEAVANFSKQGVKATAFAVDLADNVAVKKTIAEISKLGSIHIIFWNPYGKATGLIDSTANDLNANLNVCVTSLMVAVQAALPDLEKNKGAVLVTGGGLSLENDYVVNLAVEWNALTLATAKAAQRKFVAIAHASLKPKGVFVGEVTVMGVVKGTPFDAEGKSTLTAEAIANKFDEHLTKRSEVFTSIS